MPKLFARTTFGRWGLPLVLTALAVGVVLAAPLASPNKASANVVIAGARSLSDQVTVTYGKAAEPGSTTDVHILAFNDLHGTLEPGSQNLYGRFAGGAAYLATAVKAKQTLYGKNQATVFAGDNIGASPLANGLFHEEPITIASNLMNVDFASVGNHEFDKGSAELLRIQNGGCHADGCTGAPYATTKGKDKKKYPGADFEYLSANVVVNETGKTLFPAFGVKKFKPSSHGKKLEVGFIGEVLEATPTIVTPTGVAGLTFQDEADAANAVVRADKGKAKHVDAWVLVIHEGGFQSGTAALNGCAGNLGGSAIAEIASRLDPEIKVIVSAHTHAEYRCTMTIGGVTRLLTSASSFGRILTDITLTLDDKTGELLAATAANSIVENALNPRIDASTVRQPDHSLEDSQVQAVVDQYTAAAAPLANVVIGKIQGDLLRAGAGANAQGEQTLGDVIADGQYEATKGAGVGAAQLAFMNPGGIRGDLLVANQAGTEAPGEITYGEAFTVQPFGNSLVTKTMNGDMIRRLLQQQFRIGFVPPTPGVPGSGNPGTACNGGTAPGAVPGSGPPGRVLQISSTFRYESDPFAATCVGKIGRMWLNNVEILPTDTTTTFRVTMNNFLADGGDGFTVFREGTNSLGGAQDIDAFAAYFANPAIPAAGIPVPALNRIVPKP